MTNESIPVFSIVLLSNGLHHIEIAAATEMSFDFRTQPNDDYDKVIETLCHLAPAMMRVDAALMEMMDGGGERPRPADLTLILQFVKKYRARLENVNVGMSGFRGL